jgi:hypothetical protein
MNPLMSDKGKLAALIVAGPAKKSSEDTEEYETKGDAIGFEEGVAVEEMMLALEKKDKQAFGAALKSFIELCGDKYEESDEEEEESES